MLRLSALCRVAVVLTSFGRLSRSGRVQPLPNGNTLVVETDAGRALELTEDGEVVWEFRSPYRVRERGDKVASLYSLERVGADKTSWLDSKKKSVSQQK